MIRCLSYFYAWFIVIKISFFSLRLVCQKSVKPIFKVDFVTRLRLFNRRYLTFQASSLPIKLKPFVLVCFPAKALSYLVKKHKFFLSPAVAIHQLQKVTTDRLFKNISFYYLIWVCNFLVMCFVGIKLEVNMKVLSRLVGALISLVRLCVEIFSCFDLFVGRE